MKRTEILIVGSLVIAGLVFFLSRSQVRAQEHSHEAPHGGQVRTMGDHHVEFLVVEGEKNQGHVVVFLLDEGLKPVPADRVEGIVYVTLPDKSKQTLKLIASTEIIETHHDADEEHEHEKGEVHHDEKDEHGKAEGRHDKEDEDADEHGESHGAEGISHLQVEMNLKGVDSFDAVVSLKIDNKRKNLRFKYVRGEHEHEEGEEHDVKPTKKDK